MSSATTTYVNRYYNIASSPSNATATKHIFTPSGELLATVIGTSSAATTTYLHLDYLGGTNVATNGNQRSRRRWTTIPMVRSASPPALCPNSGGSSERSMTRRQSFRTSTRGTTKAPAASSSAGIYVSQNLGVDKKLEHYLLIRYYKTLTHIQGVTPSLSETMAVNSLMS